MKYSETPIGHYRVVLVVDKWTQTAVIHRGIEASTYTKPDADLYLLVTDMMPQMMVEGYIFTVGGNAR